MWKAILAGSTALVVAGSTLVYAQQRGPDGQRWRPSVEDLRAFGDARIAALRAGLSLNAEQEKNWPAFEQAARDYAKFRLDRFAALREARERPQADPIERARERAKAMADTATTLQRLVDATEPLYRSLDDAQKRRFAILAGRVAPGMGRSGLEGRARHFHRGEGREDRDRDRPRRFERRGDGSLGDGDPRFQRGPRTL